MKNIKQSLIYISLLVMTGVSCNKFLSKEPDNRTDLNSVQKVSLILGTAYPQANYVPMYESASDNAADRGLNTTQSLLNDNSYFFDSSQTGSDQDTPEFYWTNCYAAIAAANNALDAISKASDTASYQSQKGEALICRAYAHFMLVNTFAPTYNPGGDNSELSIPYVEAPETKVQQTYKRLSVQAVYDKIERDLLAGIPLLNDDRYDRPKWHFTKVAANAFATRFYLFKKEYQKVIDYANASFPSSSISAFMRPWNTTYLSYTATEMSVNYTKSDQTAVLLMAESTSWWARNVNAWRYGMNYNIATQSVYKNTIVGGNWAQRSKAYYYGGEPNRLAILKWNEYFVETSLNSSIGQGYDMVPLFTAEEVLFNRAEAEAYLNQTNNALSDLTIYAASHISSYSATNNAVTMDKINAYYTANPDEFDSNVPNLVRAIMNFKRVEFIQEGLRWLDLMRYHIPITHTGTELGATRTETLSANDPRRAFAIPATAKQGFEN